MSFAINEFERVILVFKRYFRGVTGCVRAAFLSQLRSHRLPIQEVLIGPKSTSLSAISYFFGGHFRGVVGVSGRWYVNILTQNMSGLCSPRGDNFIAIITEFERIILIFKRYF